MCAPHARTQTAHGRIRERQRKLSHSPPPSLLSPLPLPPPLSPSTLDPALRREFRTVTPQAIALAAAALAYLGAKPGVLAGAWDYYVADPLGRALARGRGVTRSDVAVGRRIATGGFGSVFRATLTLPGEGAAPPRAVILKKATEFGPAEAWMNERCARGRVTRRHVAAFVAAFDEADGGEEEEAEVGRTSPPSSLRKKKRRAGPAAAADGGPLWLVWEDEGGVPLSSLLARRDWPACAEPLLFGRPLAGIPPGPRRRAAVLRALATQLFAGLDALHTTGIVHRDIKPQNLILLQNGGQSGGNEAGNERACSLKLIDLGAAADLRVGINYTPNELLLDPRYAPPEQYVMDRTTPRAPPPALAAALSPVLWAVNRPDRFDSYSAGVTLLQAALPSLRSDNAIVAFRERLATVHGGDVRAWAAEARRTSGGAKGGSGEGGGPAGALLAGLARAVAASTSSPSSSSPSSPPAGAAEGDGWDVLDLDGGAAWDLIASCMRVDPGARPSAAAALRSPWLRPSSAGGASGSGGGEAFDDAAAAVGALAESVTAPVAAALAGAGAAAGEALASAAAREGGLSEAMLAEELSRPQPPASTSPSSPSPSGPPPSQPFSTPSYAAPRRGASATIAWWKGRQAALVGARRAAARSAAREADGTAAERAVARRRAAAGAAVVADRRKGRAAAAAAAAASMESDDDGDEGLTLPALGRLLPKLPRWWGGEEEGG